MVNQTQALAELKSFFLVAKEFQEKTGKTANMPKCIVDTVWHDLLEQPITYADLTNDVVGCEVEHLANNGEGEIEWTEVYERRFGKLPAVWFISPEGNFDREAFDHYSDTGVLKMSWDCTPAGRRTSRPDTVRKATSRRIPAPTRRRSSLHWSRSVAGWPDHLSVRRRRTG